MYDVGCYDGKLVATAELKIGEKALAALRVLSRGLKGR